LATSLQTVLENATPEMVQDLLAGVEELCA